VTLTERIDETCVSTSLTLSQHIELPIGQLVLNLDYENAGPRNTIQCSSLGT